MVNSTSAPAPRSLQTSRCPPNLFARLAPRMLARANSIARSKVSTSSEVRSCPGAAIADVNEVTAAKR